MRTMLGRSSNSPLRLSRLLTIIVGALLATCLGFFLLLNAWSSSQTIIAYDSMLAFLAITCSAAILVQYRVREHAEQTVFHAALFFAAIISMGRAIIIIYENNPVYEYSRIHLLIDLVFLAIFSSLVFIGMVMKKKGWLENRRQSAVILILSSVLIHLFLSFVIIPTLPEDSFIIVGTILGIYSGIVLPMCGFMWSTTPGGSTTYEANLFVAGFAIYGLSYIPFLVTLYFPSNAWTISYILWSMGLVILGLAPSVAFQVRIGMKLSRAYLIPLALSLLVIVPTGTTLTVVTYMPTPPTPNVALFIVLHLGASLIALSMAFLMNLYNTHRPAPQRRPVILLFITWATIESYQVIKAVLTPPDTLELSIIPYLVGSVLLLLELPKAIKMTGSTPEVQPTFSKSDLLIVPAVFAAILFSEYTQIIMWGSGGYWGFQPLCRALLLASTLLSMFLFFYYTSVQIKDGKGRITVDLLATGFLALWIVPSLIKANFQEWTLGWWSSELILLLAILMGPSFLGLMYLKEMSRAEASQKRATLFADLLVHDISNYHQALALSIGLLEMEDAGPLVKEQAIRDSKNELQRADHLIRNVRQLGMADQLTPERLSSVDLIPILQEAFQLTSRKSPLQEVRFKIDYEFETCLVLANSLLIDVFLNIFDNAIKYSKGIPEIEVAVTETALNHEPWWSIRVSDHGEGIEPERRTRMFERYMKDASGTGLGMSVAGTIIHAFGGSIKVEERVPGDYHEGTVFTILLRRA